MKYVVLVAPYLGDTMLKCLQSFCALSDVRLGVISHQGFAQFPKALQARISGHYQVTNALDPADLIKAVQAFQKEWGRVDRLIGYLEHLQLPLAETRSALNIPGMKANVARNFRDKNRMKEVLSAAKLPVARQAKIHSLQEVQQFLLEVQYPIILKPLAGVGSKNTVRVNNEKDLYSALNLLIPSPSNPIQAEEFVLGEEHTLESVSINGKVVWQSSTYYLPGPLAVLENPFIQYCVLLPSQSKQTHVKKFAKTNELALKALGMETGLSHMEWFLQDSGRALVSEVGARPPGVNIMTMMSIAHDVNIWDKWAELMVHDKWSMPRRKLAAGCAFLRHQGSGKRVNSITGVDEVREKLGEQWVSAKLPFVGQPKSTHYEGEGWIIVKGKKNEEVIEALRTIITTIQIR